MKARLKKYEVHKDQKSPLTLPVAFGQEIRGYNDVSKPSHETLADKIEIRAI